MIVSKKFEHEIMSVNGQLSDKIKLVKELQVEKSRQQEISKKLNQEKIDLEIRVNELEMMLQEKRYCCSTS